MLRPFVVAVSAALVVLGVAPAAQAAKPAPVAFTVWDGGSSEYFKSCSPTPPYPCGTFAHSMYVQITGPWPPRTSPITLGYEITPLTATAGADFTHPLTGTVQIPANQYVTGLNVPLVVDTAVEGNETFRVRLTSSSIGGDISDTGIGTIYDGGQIPLDCDLSQPNATTASMTCTGRPAGQQWRHTISCGDEWPQVGSAAGNIVLGNGTSTAQCTAYNYRSSSFHVVT